MERVKKLLKSPGAVTLLWLTGVVLLWELGAGHIAQTKRTPENVLPHIAQIFESVISSKAVSKGQTALQIVLSNAGATLTRVAIGFTIGAALGFLLALAMRLSGLVEKTMFPYLMLIQMIPILGMAPIVLAVTRDIGVSRVVIAAILTFYPV